MADDDEIAALLAEKKPGVPREETAEARAARLRDCATKHIQPLKPLYLAKPPPMPSQQQEDTTEKKTEEREEEAPPPKKTKKARGQNRKRPRDEVLETDMTEEPPGSERETNRLPSETARLLSRRAYDFETPHRSTHPITKPFNKTIQKAPDDFFSKNGDLTPLKLRERKLIDFSNKVYVAPLTTVGNLPFRRILVSLGADVTCGEMALATPLIQGQASEWSHIRRHADEKLFGAQIAAAHGDQMARCCELLRDFAPDLDFVDINMGCPLDAVCGAGAGACLPTRRPKAQSVVEAALATLPCAVTMKIRTGWDADKRTAHTFAGYAQSWQIHGRGLEAVFVHGRSRQDRYARLADWRYINKVAACQDDTVSPLPVIGNGDILSFRDWEERKEMAPNVERCAMLARGALIKPWLPTEIKERRDWDISASERLEILRKFVKFGFEHWGADAMGVKRTRRFLLEWLSFLYRYTPVALLETLPQKMNDRPPLYYGRSDLETLFASPNAADWIRLSEILIGKKVEDDFKFEPKHKANSYVAAIATSSQQSPHGHSSRTTKGASSAGQDWG